MLQVTERLAMLVQNTCDAEANVVSIERILEYTTLPSEVYMCEAQIKTILNTKTLLLMHCSDSKFIIVFLQLKIRRIKQ